MYLSDTNEREKNESGGLDRLRQNFFKKIKIIFKVKYLK